VLKRFNNLESFLRSPRGSADAYLSATLLVVFASILRWGLGFVGDLLLPFTAYYPAILFATYSGGLAVGCYAAILGGLIGWWAFLPPHFTFLPLSSDNLLEILIYVVASIFIVWGADSYRILARNYRETAIRLEEEERLRKLAVEELAHRLKNKIATIQAIVSFQLRGHPELRDAIDSRLVALAATDDLILAAQNNGADIRDLITTELAAYEVSRVSTDGGSVFLPPKLAMTMALMLHELATNAAKYGALSTQSGMVSLRWSISEGALEVFWRESGGPGVTPPTHRGFGLRLISGALDQFKGSTETAFESTGIICKIKVPLPNKIDNTGDGDLGSNGRTTFATE
jgi:two-component sensor histidine kinase